MTNNNNDTGIVWLASYPKSGNTWVRSFLNNLHAVMENGLDVEAQDINKMQQLTAWDIGAKQYQKYLNKPIAECSDAEIDGVRIKVQQAVAERNSGILLVKTHNALVMSNGHPTINFSVTAGAIYIVRNPLDVAISFSHHIGLSIDEAIRIMSTPGHRPKNSIKTVGEVYGSWSENVDSWTKSPHPAMLSLRYEDMHSDPEKSFGRLAAHLRQDPSKKELQKAIELSSFKSLQNQEEASGFTEKPKNLKKFFRSGKTNQWEEELTEQQIATIRAVNGLQMEKFGY
ncbi:hypothetical protein A9Q96_00450 [Rhodobacterales bacterium 52_120_T64]|nr:hypothetical protein A9Q96_00450 [Rhodobacterales bacterium 52_120_T64]